MSSSDNPFRAKAQQQAKELIAKAVKDGEITKSDFQKGSSWLSPNQYNNTYMADEIARALRDDPSIKLGENSHEITGVRLKDDGQIVHAFRPGVSANYGGNGGSVTFPGRASYDGGSPHWIQNSAGSYTYIGDPVTQQKEEPQAEKPTPKEPRRDPFKDLRKDDGGKTDDTYGGGYTKGGSIHFKPGRDMIQSVADFGNDSTDDYFNRFLPQAYGVAMRGNDEIDASAQFHLDRFIGKVPSLGSGKDLYNYYKKRI
jgi:hypothetical protein